MNRRSFVYDSIILASKRTILGIVPTPRDC
jgi:hypothetical protein